MKKLFLVISALLVAGANAQTVRRAAIGFYNVENLFDTIASADYIDGTLSRKNPAFHRSIPLDSVKLLPHEEYKGPWSDELLVGKRAVRHLGSADEFTPNSAKRYDTKTYNHKLANTAKVISEIGSKYTRSAPAVVGMVEIENRQVLEDLVKQPALAKYNYGIVHFNSYDFRGIDNALIYQKGRFVVTDAWKKELKIFNENGKREYTRDLLVVTGRLDGDKVAFFVNHWPSRRGGEAISLPKRNAAAALLKQQMDSVRALDSSYRLIAMGDFNDDPISPSFRNYVKAVGDPAQLSETMPYYNPMYKMYKSGVASLAYQDAPNLFDQMILSANLINQGKAPSERYTMLATEVYAPAYLINKDGNFKGYPFRSWSGDTWTGGYSDHFPVFTVLQKAAGGTD